MPKISAVIFDMDGLIVDSESIARVSWEKAAAEFGYVVDDALFARMLGITLPDLVLLHTKHFGEDFPFDEVRKRRIEIGNSHIDQHGLKLKLGAIECLDYLRENNLPHALATSTFREKAEKKLELTKFPYEFSTMICGDEIERGKPEPDIFLKAASKLGVEPGCCLVLEDSYAGIKAAKAAAMHAVFVPDMAPPNAEVLASADYVLDSLLDVPVYLQSFL